MHRFLSSFLVVAFLCGVAAAAEEEQADKNAALKAKAVALVREQEGRVDKLITLQEFVRDEIREVKTQYG